MSEGVAGSECISYSGSVVAIVGSRTFPYSQFPDQCVQFVGQQLLASGWSVSAVVSGGADGADSAGAEWAHRAGVPVTEIEPDWAKHGKAAGMIRNTDIIRSAEKCLAIWNGSSSGTRDSISKARALLGDSNIRIAGIGGADPQLASVTVADVE